MKTCTGSMTCGWQVGTNLLAELNAHLLADSLGHTHGGHSPGLGAPHQPKLGVAILMQVLGHLQGAFGMISI